jgi:hypothetical protein
MTLPSEVWRRSLAIDAGSRGSGIEIIGKRHFDATGDAPRATAEES